MYVLPPDLLIVPYGIETHYIFRYRRIPSALLIVPYGIETNMLYNIF